MHFNILTLFLYADKKMFYILNCQIKFHFGKRSEMQSETTRKSSDRCVCFFQPLILITAI